MLRAGPRRCSQRGSARGPAPRAAPAAGRRAAGEAGGRQRRRVGKAPNAGRRRRPRDSEWQKKVWVSARGSCLGAASRKESPTPSQTLLASLALMRRSLRRGSLASPLPSSFPARSLARSLARWAGPGRAPRSRSRSRPLPVCVSCKSACSLLSKRCHRPLAAGAPRLLPRAPPPPPPGALPTPSLREGARPSPARRRARPRGRPGPAAALAGARRTPCGPDLESGGRREEVVGTERREGRAALLPWRPLSAPTLRKLGCSGGQERARLAASERRLARGWRCTSGGTPVRERAHGRLRPRKSGRALGCARADPGQGPWRRRSPGS